MTRSTDTSRSDEAEHLAALKAGDQRAFAEMVERHSGTVYNVALRMTGTPQEAEEVLQETFISAFRALPRFEGRSQLGTWLFRIAYNAALMRLRRREPITSSIDEPLMNEEGELMPRQLVDWAWVPERVLLNAELRAVLESAVTALPETLRGVFVLRDIEGLSTAEAAKVLGLTETNVKVRLHRARLALRERLSAYFAVTKPGAARPAVAEAYAPVL